MAMRNTRDMKTAQIIRTSLEDCSDCAASFHFQKRRALQPYTAALPFPVSKLFGKGIDGKFALTRIAAANLHDPIRQIVDHGYIGVIGILLTGMDTDGIIPVGMIRQKLLEHLMVDISLVGGNQLFQPLVAHLRIVLLPLSGTGEMF